MKLATGGGTEQIKFLERAERGEERTRKAKDRSRVLKFLTKEI